MSVIQRRKRAVGRTWLVYHTVANKRMAQGDSMAAFVWDTLPIMFVATAVSLVSGRQWHGVTKYLFRL